MTSGLSSILNTDWERLQFLTTGHTRKRRFYNNFSPRFLPVAILRYANFLYMKKYRKLAKLLSMINYVIFSLEVPASLSIGPGIVLPHPNGVILGASIIGNNVTIFQQVTLGAVELDFAYNHSLRPRICDNVIIGAGAKVMGGVSVGCNSKIGANAVVLKDVDPDQTAVGIPAKNVRA